MSGLDELTREDLIALVLKLDETREVQEEQIGIQAARISELEAMVERQAERISELEEQLSKLGGPKSKPEWVKANKPKVEFGDRKKRTQSFSRRSLAPTRVCYHAVETCADCGRKLSGGSVKWRHQVVDIPQSPVEVTDHLFVERMCGVCGKRFVPDSREILGEVVAGKRCIGIGLMSLIAHLKTTCRIPVRVIGRLLKSLYGIEISKGAIVGILHAVAEMGEPEYLSIRERIRGSPLAHGDETGWRENGVNGYLWSFSTPEVRYFTYNHSRSSAVVKEVLGEEFAGALVSDFYAGYNAYEGVKQRCWVHMKRDLDALSERDTDNESVVTWVKEVLEVYWRAKETVSADYSESQRCCMRRGFEAELQSLADPYLVAKNAPQRVLSQRIDRFLGELFTFVQYPFVPSENNAAERAIRPAVIARKVSGGTRSHRGSKTSSVLRSLFETWSVQGLNTIDACREMIVCSNRKSLPATDQ